MKSFGILEGTQVSPWSSLHQTKEYIDILPTYPDAPQMTSLPDDVEALCLPSIIPFPGPINVPFHFPKFTRPGLENVFPSIY